MQGYLEYIFSFFKPLVPTWSTRTPREIWRTNLEYSKIILVGQKIHKTSLNLIQRKSYRVFVYKRETYSTKNIYIVER